MENMFVDFSCRSVPLSNASTGCLAMEDAHAAVLALEAETPSTTNSFFAVYDGHGGACYPALSTRLTIRDRSIRVCRWNCGKICRPECAQEVGYRTSLQGEEI